MPAPIGCVNCGACCDFSNHAPFILPADIRHWLEKRLWWILKELRFIISARDGNPENKTEENLEQQWTFRTVSKEDKTCVFRKDDATCRIYKVRPLACSCYPSSATCLNGRIVPVDKKTWKRYKQAHREWIRTSREWRQDKLKAIHEELEKILNVVE